MRGFPTVLAPWRLASAAICAALCALAVPAAADAAGKPLAFTKVSLQPTRTVEEPGAREVLEEARRTQHQANFPAGTLPFRTEPASYTQAGGHPDLTFTAEFATEIYERHKGSGELFTAPTRDPKDIATLLPPGLLGNPTAVKRCPLALALSGSHCPFDSQIGVAVLRIFGGSIRVAPIYDVVPEAGQSAEFTIETSEETHYVLTAHLVRSPEGYGVVVESNGIVGTQLYRVELTFWGVPASSSHNLERGLVCDNVFPNEGAACGPIHGHTEWGFGVQPSGEPEVPFMILPTGCTVGSESARVRADSWEQPGAWIEESVSMPPVTGCGLVQFVAGTGIELHPNTTLADAPVETEVDLKIPQPQSVSPAAPQLRETRVTLPPGMSVSSGIVDGIEACEAHGPHGIDIPTGLNSDGRPVVPGEAGEGEEIGLNGEPQLAPGHCPQASTIGEAEAVTPLLPSPVKGHLYLAKPECGGAGEPACTPRDALDGKLFKLYLELGGTGEYGDAGINFKVPFDVEADPATGQLTAVVKEIMQAPVSEVKVRLNGGPRASMDNPAVCGPATTTAVFSPWSAPGELNGQLLTGTPDASVSSYFDVEGCSDPQPFNPGFVAGTVTPNAGKFSSFTMNLSRADREQFVKGIQIHTPPGLLGKLASVPLCGEPQADQGTCPESSKIGTTRVATGAGSHPFEVEGSVYLTGPYGGDGHACTPGSPGCAPFGLSVVTHAVAGPFNLGLVVVRAKIDVNPTDSTLTVTTDETGPYALPQIIFGVPLRLKRVTVNIDRPGFMFNPTNCKAQAITAAISGTGQSVADVSSPFAVGNCTALRFEPRFAVSTQGRTSRAAGASLDAKLSYPSGAMGRDANIAYVKVSLPKALPSFLPTLQKACLAATFNTNPAACPPGSVVGIARTSTPLLPAELSGPVYFVSHGGEEFPSLIVVLQGDGVRVDLTGSTFINKAGITSSTFKTIPDVPVNSFELYLPQGKNHALAANTNLCTAAQIKTRLVKHKVKRRVKGKPVPWIVTKRVKSPGLVMPTEFLAQNGAVLKQNTPISVNGCGKAQPKKQRKRSGNKGKSARRGRR